MMWIFYPRHSIISFVLNLQTLPQFSLVSLVGEHNVEVRTHLRVAPIAG